MLRFQNYMGQITLLYIYFTSKKEKKRKVNQHMKIKILINYYDNMY